MMQVDLKPVDRWRRTGIMMTSMVAVFVAAVSLAQSHPPDFRLARLFSIEAVNETDARLGFFVGQRGSYRILARDVVDGEERVLTTGSVTRASVRYWVDKGVLEAPGQRFYVVDATIPISPKRRSFDWGLYVQERTADASHLVSFPVSFPEGISDTSRLQGAFGKQLMYGLAAGARTNDADRVAVMNADGEWVSAYLVQAADGEAQWCETDLETPSALEFQSGRAFWIHRNSGDPRVTSKGIFAGPLPMEPTSVTFSSAGRGITPFGVYGSEPKRHRNAEKALRYSTPANQLGFATLGSGGSTADIRRDSERGDQVWVWGGNGWAKRYWLMGHLGDKWDGKWWDPQANDFADFSLEPGVGYYYVHRTNTWGGTDFDWTP
jgi:hypothetical protein